MPTLDEIVRIQSYLRENVRRNSVYVAVPPFSLFFHPADPLKYFNYAIPDGPGLPEPYLPEANALSGILARLRQEFRQRGRVARFEFFEAFAPELPAALRAHGFREEGRQWSMLCTPASFRPAPDVLGLEITALQPDSPEADMRDFLTTQRRGFDPQDVSEPSESDIARERENYHRHGWRAFLGRVNGAPAGVSAYGQPIGGVSEIGGVATLVPFRRRGIAARLTAQAVQAAFSLGVDTACLTAEDEAAGRVYERIGFVPFSTMLAYIDDESY